MTRFVAFLFESAVLFALGFGLYWLFVNSSI